MSTQATTSLTDSNLPWPTCTYRSTSNGSSYRHDCGKPAVAVEIIKGHRAGYGDLTVTEYRPRCNRHRNLDARYGSRKFEDITPEIQSAIQYVLDATKERIAEEQAKKAEQQAIRVAAAKAAAADEAALPVVVVREDKPGELDWDAMRSADKHEPVYGAPIPQWIVKTTGGRDWDNITVAHQRRQGYPLAIELRSSSQITVKQAAALAEVLWAAVKEATK